MATLKTMGVLWTIKGPDGKPRYFSGYINCGILGDIAITVFKNRYKNKEGDPDFNIVLAHPKASKEDEIPPNDTVSNEVSSGGDTVDGAVPF